MKSPLSIFKIFLIGCALFFLASCSSENTTEETGTHTTDDTTAIAVADTTTTPQDFFYSLPSPMSMVKSFKRSGIKYVEGAANSPSNISKYVSTESKAFNMGVYSADLAYTVINKQTQQALKYMESVKKLSDDLGMSSLFDSENIVSRFKSNLGNEDSLVVIVAALKSEMDIYMNDNEKEKQSLYVFIGAWIENLYLATQLTNGADKNKVAMRVAEQKFVLNSLMSAIAKYKQDAGFKDTYTQLSELKMLFDKLGTEGEEEKLVMDDANLKTISEKTSTIRKQITQSNP